MDEVSELMKRDYDLLIDEIEDENAHYFSLSYPELPGLTIYADSVEVGLTRMKDAKLEWFYAAVEAGTLPYKKNTSQ